MVKFFFIRLTGSGEKRGPKCRLNTLPIATLRASPYEVIDVDRSEILSISVDFSHLVLKLFYWNQSILAFQLDPHPIKICHMEWVVRCGCQLRCNPINHFDRSLWLYWNLSQALLKLMVYALSRHQKKCSPKNIGSLGVIESWTWRTIEVIELRWFNIPVVCIALFCALHRARP